MGVAKTWQEHSSEVERAANLNGFMLFLSENQFFTEYRDKYTDWNVKFGKAGI